jgi:hypothetical protein
MTADDIRADRPIEPSNYDLAGIPDFVYEWAKRLEKAEAAHTAQIAALEARVRQLEEAVMTTAEQALLIEIPENEKPDENVEWNKGYDAAVSVARAVLKRMKP